MYKNFYYLKKEPFHITPDPEFLFLSPSHKEALAAIIYGVTKRKGFLVITGEVGVGKTTILRSYLERVSQQRVKTIYIFNANVSFRGLLKTIYQELGLDARTDDVFEMINHLHQVLIEEYRQGNNVVLIVDEAQNMPIKTLENLRMLSNLETSKDKLLQIVLVGQPEFEKMLNLKELRQLKQRIALHTTIYHLTGKESKDYIRHRLAKAARRESTIFTRGALGKINKKAKGIPRILNILCNNALVTGYGYQKRPINTKIAREVIADFEGKRKYPVLRWGFATLTVLLLMAGLFWASPYKNRVLSWVENSNLLKTIKLSPIIEKIEPSMVNPDLQEATLIKKEKGSLLENPDLSKATHTYPIEKGIESFEGEIPELPESSFPAIRVVKEGDNLFRLTEDVYGFVNNRLVEYVKQNNPQLHNANKILVGEEIYFPELKNGQEAIGKRQ